MYAVHMRSLTPTEARKNWFRLLDDVAAGEVIEIRRGAHRIVLRSEPYLDDQTPSPDYSGLIAVQKSDQAAQWGWEWNDEGLSPTGP